MTTSLDYTSPFVKSKPVKLSDVIEKYAKMKKEKAAQPQPIFKVETSTRMSLQHFHDFYFLQAMQAAVTTEKILRPELEFSKSVEKFEDKLAEICEDIFPNMALRTFVYLYAACYGESRHAQRDQAKEKFIVSAISDSRGNLFREIASYPPTKENIQALVDVFAQPWHSGFGGEAWRKIAEALLTYLTLPASTFIDHIVDLEHNNGTVFSKADGNDCLMFNVRYPGRFSKFLDFKFRNNVLQDFWVPESMGTLNLSPKVYYLFQKYTNVFGKKMPEWIQPELENLTEYVIKWGNEKFVLEDKWHEWVDVSSGNEPTAQYLYEASGMDDIYAPKITAEGVIKHAEKCTKKAMEIAGKKITKRVKKEFKEKVSTWKRWALTVCAAQRAKVTYSVIPLKVRTLDKFKFQIQVPLPYECVGTKTEYGFEIVIDSRGGFLPKIEQNLGYDGQAGQWFDGHISKDYGETIIHIDCDGKEKYFYLGTTKLEAILD